MASQEEVDAVDDMWESKPLLLRDVLESKQLPLVVKVCEGLYGSSEGFSFSNGDLLKLDFKVTVEKVRARKAKRPALNQMNMYEAVGETFTVPLDYPGKVGLVPDLGEGEEVTLLNDLREHGVRWIRVMQDVAYTFYGRDNLLCEGDKLKVLRFEKDMLFCRRGQEAFYVPNTVNGKFEVPCDPEEYTVREVLQKFELPQVVHFLPVEEQIASGDVASGLNNKYVFTGEVMLEELVKEKLAIGHFKGSGEESGRFARRSAIILPLSDPMVAELEVLCPKASDDKDYEFFQMTHFSQSSGEPNIDPSALYVEFVKPGVRLIDYKTLETMEKPPPRPPRKGNQSGKKGNSKSDPPDEPPQRVPPDPPPPLSRLRAKALRSLGLPSLWLTLGEFLIPLAVKTIGKKLKATLFHSRPRRTSASESAASSAQLPEAEDSDDSNYEQIDDSANEYDEPIDWEVQRPQLPVPVGVVRPSTQESQQLPSRPTQTDVGTAAPGQKPSPHICVAKATKETGKDNFQELSVSDVCRLLDECKMSELAKVSRENALDGKFLSGRTPDELGKPPFNMTEFDVLRLEEIKNGWRPKI